MCNISKLIKQLRSTIGVEVEYNGSRCAVVELLEQPLCLVVEALSARSTIQDNQFGSPQRRVSRIFTIPCLSESNDGTLHQELLSLGLRLE